VEYFSHTQSRRGVLFTKYIGRAILKRPIEGGPNVGMTVNEYSEGVEIGNRYVL
jgi:hypothetical protein